MWEQCIFSSLFRVLLTIVVVALSCPLTASADVNGADSVEFMTLSSDVVIRAAGPRFVEPGDPNRHVPARWRVKVIESLKGQASDKVHVMVGLNWHDEEEMRDWQQTGGERVLFLCRRAMADQTVPRDAPTGALVARDREWMLPVRRWRNGKTGHTLGYTRDFRAIHDYESLCGAVRESLEIAPRESALAPVLRDSWQTSFLLKRGVSVWVPSDSDVWSELHARSAVCLAIPLDDATEQLGREWANDPNYAREGLSILAHFKSESNARLMQRCLKDRSAGSNGEGRNARWYYDNRNVAYETLRYWGHNVSRPPMRGPDDLYHSARAPLALFAGAIGAVVLSIRLRRYEIRRFARSFTLIGLGALTLAAALALFLRRDHVFEFTFKLAGSRHWLATPYGQLVWITVHGWPDGQDARIALFRFSEGANGQLWKPISYLTTSTRQWKQFNWTEAQQPWGDGPQRPLLPYMRLAVPLWSVIIVTGTPVVVCALVALRRTRRYRLCVRNGLCLNCGYDLRATAGQCPECGMISDDGIVRPAKFTATSSTPAGSLA